MSYPPVAGQQISKKGEVVGPAGGETGVPRCLAEVRKLQEAANLQHVKSYTNTSGNACQKKKRKVP